MESGIPTTYDRARYERKRELIAQQRASRRRLILDRLDEIKIRAGCLHCGERDPVVLQFHHRDPATKRFDVSRPNGRSPRTVLNETAKCDVLCANCHMRHHARERAFAGVSL